MVLVDTSVWVDFLRGTASPQVPVLAALLASDTPVFIAPPILQEVLQGADTRERQRAWLRRFSEIVSGTPMDANAMAISAANLYLSCRLAGKTVRSSNDCLIACIAIHQGLQLLHNDKDFEAIVSVEPQLKLLPIPPARTIARSH